jgi:hypothetical protein
MPEFPEFVCPLWCRRDHSRGPTHTRNLGAAEVEHPRGVSIIQGVGDTEPRISVMHGTKDLALWDLNPDQATALAALLSDCGERRLAGLLHEAVDLIFTIERYGPEGQPVRQAASRS